MDTTISKKKALVWTSAMVISIKANNKPKPIPFHKVILGDFDFLCIENLCTYPLKTYKSMLWMLCI
jgi:hypothetical protein